MHHQHTKIVCTIGPASASIQTLEKMVRAGMDCARLNFSHGKYEEFAEMIKTIRTVSKKLGIPVAIIQDLQGPKIRVGEVKKGGMELKKGGMITLINKSIEKNNDKLQIQFPGFHKLVQKNDPIFLCDGLIELKVQKIQDHNVLCKVIQGGLVTSRKGVNIPFTKHKVNPLTLKDRQDLIFGLKHEVDYVALSFVERGKDVKELRELIKKNKGQAKIIAKIERQEAVKNLEEIMEEADAIMVARGDLGIETPPEHLPILQKKIIHLANLYGKPVITATEMLQSMIENPRATRAEVSDIANAVLDHTDAIMLSNESAVGKYPVKAVETLAKVAASTENYIKKHENFLPNRLFKNIMPLQDGLCSSAAELAQNIKARFIVTLTASGFTAEQVAKHRVHIPIIAVTGNEKIQRQLQLVWGVTKAFVQKISLGNYQAEIRKLLRKEKLGKSNDKVVIICNASQDEKEISTIVL